MCGMKVMQLNIIPKSARKKSKENKRRIRGGKTNEHWFKFTEEVFTVHSPTFDLVLI